MSININEATLKIKKAGAGKVRCVPMPGQNVNTGHYQIEIQEGTEWTIIAEGMTRFMANDLIEQALNRIICEG